MPATARRSNQASGRKGHGAMRRGLGPDKEVGMKLNGLIWKIVGMTAVLLLAPVVCFAERPGFASEQVKACFENSVFRDKALSKLDNDMREADRSLLSQLEGQAKEDAEQGQARSIKATDKRSDPETLTKRLVEAVRRGDVALAKTLLNKGADPNFEGLDSESPLIAAIRSGHLELVKLLLDKGADANRETGGNESGVTPLIIAASIGDLELIKLLLDKGADINAASGDDTPLMQAAGGGKLEVVKLLISRGADVNLEASEGFTPLKAAASQGHFDVV
jgi:ankyrin repeat protein